MYIEMKKCVNVPKNFFCEGCSAKSKNAFGDIYCDVTGKILKPSADGNGKCVKTTNCFAEIRKHLINGGK